MTSDTPDQPQNGVVVGRIISAAGLRGEVKVEVLSDFPGRFAPGSVLLLGGASNRVQRSRPAKGVVVLKLEGVNDRPSAEALCGAYLTVPSHSATPSQTGSYYHFQIIGIEVWTESAQYLGTVREILHTGANDVYVVRDRADREVLLPAVGEVVVAVDLPSNRMVVRLTEGLQQSAGPR